MQRFSVILFAAGLLAAGLASCSEAAPAEPTAVAAAPTGPTTTATLAVNGMVCTACQKAIDEKVSSLPGVTSCTASHKDQKVVVEFEPAKVDVDKIAAVITELGYTVPPGDAVPPDSTGQAAPQIPPTGAADKAAKSDG